MAKTDGKRGKVAIPISKNSTTPTKDKKSKKDKKEKKKDTKPKIDETGLRRSARIKSQKK